jgi:putative transcriptional regulator
MATNPCPRCGGPIETRVSTNDTPYRYTISGLNNVLLIGVAVNACPKCGLEAPTIPKAGELHRLIVDGLLSREARLSGEEVRFLRKQAGFSAKKFAALLGISAEHLSRFENGDRVSESVDRLARAIVAVAVDSNAGRDLLLEFAEALGAFGAAPRFEFVGGRSWRLAA